MTCKIKRALCLAVLAAVLAVPARAAAPYLTPDSTVAELHGNEGIVGAGFDSWDRGSLWPEQPWEYARWSLRRYIGAPVDEAVEALNLIIENYNQGVQVTYPLYTDEEIAADPTREGVALYYFPAEKPGAKYAIVLSGNMLERTARVKEGCSAVAELHRMGYAAFILNYRVGHDLKDNANYQDLVRAVQYITAHAGELQVDPENYALMGFSSGGQLCALFGTDRMGYQNYGLPKPGALLLAYPILNYAYGKPVLFYLYDRAQPGDHLAPGDYYYNVEVPAEVTADFPATFQWYGKNDTTLRGSSPRGRARRWTRRWRAAACPMRCSSMTKRPTAAPTAPAPTPPAGSPGLPLSGRTSRAEKSRNHAGKDNRRKPTR